MNNISYQHKGKAMYREATDTELCNINCSYIWHRDSKNARACFSIAQYNANMQKLTAHNLGLESHPFLAALVTKVQNGEFIRIDADGMVYYYCDYVEDADKSIIISYGGIIECKP